MPFVVKNNSSLEGLCKNIEISVYDSAESLLFVQFFSSFTHTFYSSFHYDYRSQNLQLISFVHCFKHMFCLREKFAVSVVYCFLSQSC